MLSTQRHPSMPASMGACRYDCIYLIDGERRWHSFPTVTVIASAELLLTATKQHSWKDYRADLLENRSPLPTSLSHSLAGSPLPPLEWNLSESGQEGLKLCPKSRTSETGAVTGQTEQIEGGNGARLVPRLLGLSGHRG